VSTHLTIAQPDMYDGHRWKHAVACHSGSVLVGEGNVFEDDEVFEVLKRTSTC
jgi:hypothetical protein